MKLKALKCKAFRHDGGFPDKQTLNDGKGLDLVVTRNQTKTWRLRYKFQGKRPEISLGHYPDISLEDARKLAAKVSSQASKGINPKLAQSSEQDKQRQTFKVVALEWLEVNKPAWKPENEKKLRGWLERYAFPSIGDMPMDSIDSGHITEIMLTMSNTECSPFLSVINRIFGRAMAKRLTKHNPAQGFPLRDVIPPLPKVKHRAAITDPKQLGQLLRDITETKHGSYFTQQALRLLPYIFVRPKELAQLKWDCVDFDSRLIRIAAEDMKKGRPHTVPMAKQAVEALEGIKAVSGYSPYVFPNMRNSNRPMSKNVMTNLLRQIGYSGDVCCSHGFRATASTLLSAMGKEFDVVELCLAHLIGTATSRAYNHDQKLPARTKLMQEWADYLDALRDGADVIPIKRKVC